MNRSKSQSPPAGNNARADQGTVSIRANGRGSRTRKEGGSLKAKERGSPKAKKKSSLKAKWLSEEDPVLLLKKLRKAARKAQLGHREGIYQLLAAAYRAGFAMKSNPSDWTRFLHLPDWIPAREPFPDNDDREEAIVVAVRFAFSGKGEAAQKRASKRAAAAEVLAYEHTHPASVLKLLRKHGIEKLARMAARLRKQASVLAERGEELEPPVAESPLVEASLLELRNGKEREERTLAVDLTEEPNEKTSVSPPVSNGVRRARSTSSFLILEIAPEFESAFEYPKMTDFVEIMASPTPQARVWLAVSVKKGLGP
ncbi:MAG: hypothetical protein ACJ8BE_12935 [Microvirga sp.]